MNQNVLLNRIYSGESDTLQSDGHDMTATYLRLARPPVLFFKPSESAIRPASAENASQHTS